MDSENLWCHCFVFNRNHYSKKDYKNYRIISKKATQGAIKVFYWCFKNNYTIIRYRQINSVIYSSWCFQILFQTLHFKVSSRISICTAKVTLMFNSDSFIFKMCLNLMIRRILRKGHLWKYPTYVSNSLRIIFHKHRKSPTLESVENIEP